MKEETLMDNLLALVKSKKELHGLSNIVVEDCIKEYLKKMNFTLDKIEKMSDKEKKIIVKEVRSNLRLSHGRFNHSGKKRHKLIEKEDYLGILKTHTSTKERVSHYKDLKEWIDSLKINSIIDIGCGLNPIACSDKRYIYHYLDINEEELGLVKQYFDKNNFNGHMIIEDIRKADLDKLPKTDLCLSFKLLDILKKDRYRVTKDILSKLSCKYFLISFATKTLSGKNMNNKNRFWFEKILRELNYSCQIKEFDNEIFYLISRV